MHIKKYIQNESFNIFVSKKQESDSIATTKNSDESKNGYQPKIITYNT